MPKQAVTKIDPLEPPPQTFHLKTTILDKREGSETPVARFWEFLQSYHPIYENINLAKIDFVYK